MKKWLFRILFLITAVGAIFCFTGFEVTCDGEFQGLSCNIDSCVSTCNHSYIKVDETQSTCGESGYIKYECRKCHDIQTEYKSRPEHTLTHTLHRGDCGSDADYDWYEQDACSKCDYVNRTTYYSGSALHYFDEGEIAYYEDGSGCGEITYTCLICGKTKTSNYHSEESVKMQEHMQNLTNRQCGTDIGYCDLCGKFFSFTWHKNYTENVLVAPTETEYGLIEYKCTQTNSGSSKHCLFDYWRWYKIVPPVTEQTDF